MPLHDHRHSPNAGKRKAPWDALGAARQTVPVLFAELVSTSDAVASTRARSVKIATLAEFLRRLEPEEIESAVGFLTGAPRQGRIGIGWAAVFAVHVAHAAEASISLADIDTAIEQLRSTTGSGSVQRRRDVLEDVFARATEREADFLRRLFTGELRQGALAGIMTDAVAKAAGVPVTAVRRAAMLSGDLGRTARVALTEGEEGLGQIGLTVLHPVLPMLAATSASVADALQAAGASSVEWKLDGVRIQVHRLDDEVRIYTRNLNDVTSRLPVIVDAVARLPVRAAILDGEAIWLGEDGRPRAFQDTMSTFGTELEQAVEQADADSSVPTAPLAGFYFDILHLNGRDLIDEPLGERAHALIGVAGDLRVPAVETDDPGRGDEVLRDALDHGHEGVMVKALDSTYEAGRRGSAWRKVKPVRTLDLIVLGAEWGHGRRQGWLSNLHLGARDPNGGPPIMVGKTFKGLTDKLLEEQTRALLQREVRREGIAVFVRPELVVEIALDGVQASTRYPGGVALRFARVKGYRTDKSPEDADTIDTLRSMLHEPGES
jgi:DNA ligase-1